MKRELEGGWFQWVELPLPALLTIQSGINQLRYATLKGIMAAKKKRDTPRWRAPRAAQADAPSASSAVLPEKGKEDADDRRLAGPKPARSSSARLRDEARVIWR